MRDEFLDDPASPEPISVPETLPDAASIEAFSIHPPIAESPPAPASSPGSTPGRQTGSAPASTADATPAETTTGMQPIVKETLMCSLQSEVLYQWNCSNSGERLALLEFLSKRSSAMAASLPLGTFERFESVDRMFNSNFWNSFTQTMHLSGETQNSR